MDAISSFLESGHGANLRYLDLHHMALMRLATGGDRLCQALRHCPNLTYLDLSSGFFGDDEDAEAFGQALESGACPRLETLIIAGPLCPSAYYVTEYVANAIKIGAVPHLRRLDLTCMAMTSFYSVRLIDALVAMKHDIQILNLSKAFYRGLPDNVHSLDDFLEGAAAAAATEESDSSDNNRFTFHHLDLGNSLKGGDYSSSMTEAHAFLLSKALLTKTPLPLRLSIEDHPYIGDQGMACIFNALSYRSLVALNISGAKLGYYGGQHLASFLRLGHGGCLKELSMARYAFKGGSQGLLSVLEAIRDGCTPLLQKLDVSECHYTIGGEHGRAVAEAIARGSCCQLRVLDMIQSTPLRKDWHLPIMDALAAGGCPHLTHLSTPLGNGTTASSMLALGMVTGRMPYLQGLQLNIEGVPAHAAQYGINVIRQALVKSRGCIHLKVSDSAITGRPQKKKWEWPPWCKPKWWRGMGDDASC